VGEVLTPIEPPAPWYLLVVPQVAVSTAAVFQDPTLTRSCRALTISGFLSGDHAVNVCEEVVRRRFPEVAEALDWLGVRASARMSGTGSSVFAAFDTRDAADEVRAQLPATWRGFVCLGLNRSPLLERVAAHSAGRAVHSGLR
jgi:4-diphosphocytidyl-2-C-methyl-D-erythritol kinase